VAVALDLVFEGVAGHFSFLFSGPVARRFR